MLSLQKARQLPKVVLVKFAPIRWPADGDRQAVLF